MNTASTRDLMTRLMDGYLSTQMLYVAARLGLVDVLMNGPRTSAELAAAVGAAAVPLHRLLRGLVMEGVLSEEPDGRYGVTDAGRLLRADGVGSLHGAVLARGALYYRAAAGLLETIHAAAPHFDTSTASTSSSTSARARRTRRSFSARCWRDRIRKRRRLRPRTTSRRSITSSTLAVATA